MAQKHTSSLRERDKRQKTNRATANDVQSSQNARAVDVDARRLLPSRNNTKNTHLFWSFFRRRPTRKEKEERPLKDVQKGTKKHSKKKKREEKRYDTGEREREREGAAAPKNTHDFENDAKEKELRFFKKKKN